MTGPMLPAQFAELEPFVAKWDLPDFDSRYRERLASGFGELELFHDAMMARGPEIAAYLDSKPISDFSDADRALGRLMYALAIVAQAVEVFKQVRVPDTEATNLSLTTEFQL
jgi:hypothetical protein